MIELLIMALIFSVLLNIVQALSAEFSKGYNLGMKYAKDWDKRVEALEWKSSGWNECSQTE